MLAGLQEVPLAASLLGFVVVLEPRRLGQAHEDALDPSPRLEPEDGTPIIDEVELDVAPAANLREVRSGERIGGVSKMMDCIRAPVKARSLTCCQIFSCSVYSSFLWRSIMGP